MNLKKSIIIMLGLFVGFSQPFALSLKDLKSKVAEVKDKAALSGGAKIEKLPTREGNPADKSRDCEIENIRILNTDQSTKIDLFVTYMAQMEIIHKPGIQVKRSINGKSEYIYFSQLAVYEQVLKNPEAGYLYNVKGMYEEGEESQSGRGS